MNNIQKQIAEELIKEHMLSSDPMYAVKFLLEKGYKIQPPLDKKCRHWWRRDPKSSLIDICQYCGEERA